jgi:hypothetical protein
VLSKEGNTSLTDTRGHTLTAVTQTHTVLRHHTELQPYKLDDGILLGCLFSSLSLSTLPATPSKMEPFHIKVDTVAWKNPKNRIPHRRQSPKKEMEILRQVTLLEKQGIIRRSNDQYYSQVILAPKPDDEWRLCVDFRNLNTA